MPDIVSILNLSDLYQISLDELLKGDTKMKEKIEKDVKVAKDNKRLILTTAILLVVVAIIYSISAFVGGVFYDFCEAAVRWVVLGIGVLSQCISVLCADFSFSAFPRMELVGSQAVQCFVILTGVVKKSNILKIQCIPVSNQINVCF